jgi:hypothetical protein
MLIHAYLCTPGVYTVTISLISDVSLNEERHPDTDEIIMEAYEGMFPMGNIAYDIIVPAEVNELELTALSLLDSGTIDEMGDLSEVSMDGNQTIIKGDIEIEFNRYKHLLEANPK